MPVDHFPSTHAMWIEEQLTVAEGAADAAGTPRAAAARAELQQHLMRRYHEPLRAYVRGSSLRDLGEADDLIAGFFADRVCAPGFLAGWRGSGMPLRRWLMNGISFYGRGVARDRMRDRLRQFDERAGAADSSSTAAGATIDALMHGHDAARAFEEAWALEVLNAAHAQVHADLAAAGKLDEYEVFRRHVVDGLDYATIGADMGLSRQGCANCVRRVSERVRVALRDVIRGEGVADKDVERTVREIRELLGGEG